MNNDDNTLSNRNIDIYGVTIEDYVLEICNCSKIQHQESTHTLVAGLEYLSEKTHSALLCFFLAYVEQKSIFIIIMIGLHGIYF